MKIKLKELNPNPFKKDINGGKLNKEIVNKIKSNIKELGLMGSLPIFKKEDKYYLIAGHHRLQALKDVYGNNFEVEVTLHNYSDENVLRGMVVENLTQRSDEVLEVGENLNAIRNYLIKNKISIGQQLSNRAELGSSEQVYRWLSKSQTEEVMSLSKIKQYIKIYDNLDRKLLEKAKSNLDKSEEDIVNVREAIALSRLEKKEQIPMKKLLDKADVSSDTKLRLVTEYKNSSKEIQEKVKKGEIEITDIQIENLKQDIKKKIEEDKKNNEGKIIVTHYKQYQREAGNKIGRTNNEIIQTCSYLNGLNNSGVLYELDWKTMLKIIEAGTNSGRSYTKFMEKILGKIK